MLASRYIHMFAKQRDLMGFDEVGRAPSSSTSPSCFIFRIFPSPLTRRLTATVSVLTPDSPAIRISKPPAAV